MIDVIIPCYNCEKTIERAVKSVLIQKFVNKIYLINDASIDNTLSILNNIKLEYGEKIFIENLNENRGVSIARNYGAILSKTKYIAFLDADDEYEEGVFDLLWQIVNFKNDINVIRLNLTPIDMEEKYLNNSNFEKAWTTMKMTCGGNLFFRKSFFLACGGFPDDDLFKKFGGEDGALGIATTKLTNVFTLFDFPGVLYHCRKGMHVEKLLDSICFGIKDEKIQASDLLRADAITKNICDEVLELKENLNKEQKGIRKLILEFE